MINYLIIFWLFLVLVGIIGIGVLWVVKRKVNLTLYESITLSSFSGYIILVTVFSLFQTNLKTVNFLFIILIFFAWREVSKLPDKLHVKKIKFKPIQIIILIAFSFFYFGLCYYSVSNPSGYIPFHYANPDYIVYAKISKYLSLTGQENGFSILNTLDSYYNGPEPYHFFDLWGASSVSYLFGINHYQSLMIIIYPTFYLFTFLATICIFKRINTVKILAAFVCLWIGGFYLNFFELIPILRDVANLSSNLFNPGLYKLSYFYLYFLCSYLLYSKKQYTLSILSLIGLTTANIISAPIIYPSLFIIIFYLFKSNLITKKQVYTNLLILVISTCYLIVFFSIFKSERAGLAGAEIISPLQLIKDTLSIMDLKIQRNILLGSTLFLGILYFPIVLLFFKRNSIKNLIHPTVVFITLSVLMSILIFALLYTEFNSSQIFINLSIPLLNVTLIVLCLKALESNKSRFSFKSFSNLGINFLIISAIILNIYNTTTTIESRRYQAHSSEYLCKVDSLIEEESLIASIKSVSEMTKMQFKYNTIYTLGNYLFLFNKNINSVNISDLDTPIDSSSQMNYKRSIKAIRDGLFYRFANFPENKDLNKEELQLKFLDKFNIKFLIASKNSKISQRILDRTINIILDSKSGEQFLVLK